MSALRLQHEVFQLQIVREKAKRLRESSRTATHKQLTSLLPNSNSPTKSSTLTLEDLQTQKISQTSQSELETASDLAGELRQLRKEFNKLLVSHQQLENSFRLCLTVFERQQDLL